MNYKKIFAASSAILLSFGLATNFSSNVFADSTGDKIVSKDTGKTSETKTPAQTTTSYNLMTKAAGAKNYTIWKTIDNGQAIGKVANGVDFRYNHIQSNQSIKTKKYTYWLIYIDGRRMGWVNERFFDRNTIKVAKKVTLVRNDNALFDPHDAISYATDRTGTIVDPSDVKVSNDSISCDTPETTKVKFTYGSAKAAVNVTVRKSTKEGIGNADSVEAKEGTNKLNSWATHYGASLNYLNSHDFAPETNKHNWTSGDMTLTTRFYQPVLLSVKTDSNDEGAINRVGHIPEGLTVSNGWAYTSLLSQTKLIQGHLVGYNLNKLTNLYNAQKLLTMNQKKFISYVKNIKVSQYITIGHGQAMGSTDKYIYVLANDNSMENSNDSEELLQINKSDMNINKIWTIKCWNGDENSPRYFKNAVVTSDKQMFGLCYNKDQDRYEYWELNRTGDNWYPTLVGATKSTFVGNSAPVQGFTYDSKNQNFYIEFNDLIVKLSKSGTIKDTYSYNIGREMEGISVYNNRLYVNLAQRAELLKSSPLN